MCFRNVAALAALCVCLAALPAEARPSAERWQSSGGDWMSAAFSKPDSSSQQRSRRAARQSDSDEEAPRSRTRRGSRSADTSSDDSTVRSVGSHSGLGPRPSAWCGWYMRTRHGGGPEMNLAWNWSRWGSPASPQIGAIVVWAHHVGEIVGQAVNGQWIVLSGNDSGTVRQRPRSIAGAVVRI
jgi:hypothetical protein